MPDLHSEMLWGTRSITQVHLNRLRTLGALDAFADMGETNPVGIVRAEPVGSGLYQPGEGVPHIVLPVVEDGELIDLCAFRSSQPDEWLMRVGNGWALGLHKGIGAYMWGVPPHIFRTPLDWMRGGCRGLCVLDWRSSELFQLDVFETVTVADEQTAQLLDKAMRRPVRVPNIQVMEAIRHAA